jgi:hypothetical protein
MLFPQLALQSLSFPVLQPIAQHPSPFAQVVEGACAHTTLHCAFDPVRVSTVQASESLQDAGQFPSQVSGGSVAPFPQLALQSESFVATHPLGQQASPFWQLVRAVWVHVAVQAAEVPVRTSFVQGSLSSHDAGQFPSHASPISRTPLPQTGAQSESLTRVHPPGQQPSPPVHATIDA